MCLWPLLFAELDWRLLSIRCLILSRGRQSYDYCCFLRELNEGDMGFGRYWRVAFGCDSCRRGKVDVSPYP